MEETQLSFISGWIVSLPAKSVSLLRREAGVQQHKNHNAKRIPQIYTKHTPSFLLKKYSLLHLSRHKLSKLQPNVQLIRLCEYVSAAMTKEKEKQVNVHG